MLYILMGESCTGKSTVAKTLSRELDAEVYSGNDYLQFAKNEPEALEIFEEILLEGAEHIRNVIYIIADIDQYERVKELDSIMVKFEADLDLIKNRFRQRMNGHLPRAVEYMLEKKAQLWKPIDGDFIVNTTTEEPVDHYIERILIRV